MATYYWVGGSGNWNATSTANWSDTSGGSSGFGPPTSADDVIFDAGSNTGTNPFTVTVTGTSAAPAVCLSFTTGGAGGALDGAMTLAFSNATSVLAVNGSVTFPATNFSVTGVGGSILRFANISNITFTTNGVSVSQINNIVILGGSTVTLGSALTASNINPASGTFDTGNYNVTCNQIITSGATAKSIVLGSSTVTCTASAPIDFTNTTSFTFNAGTSTITCSAASPTFTGGGQTFYNVTFSSAASGTVTINGANTFSNNLTFTSVSSTGIRFIVFGANQTINGALTFGAANTAIRRMRVISDTIGTRRTLTLNGSLATLADVDLRDIGAAGTVATPWTGTRLGDLKNNNNITFATPKTVYWNLAGSQNWSATGWATTNTGVPAANNFPLAQDTATFTEAGAAGTVTFDANWQVGTLTMADGVSNRTTAMTLATGGAFPAIYGSVTFFSSLTFTGTGGITFSGQGVTQIITSAGVSWPQALTIVSPSGTIQLSGNLTNTNATAINLNAGALDLNNNTLTCVAFNSNNANTRSVAFGTGNITVTGNGAVVFNMAGVTGFTRTGTPTVNLSYAGSTGTRTINFTTGGTEANSLDFNITAGTDTIALPFIKRSLDFTGFSGTLSIGASGSTVFYGDLKLSTGMTVSAGGTSFLFQATSGTQTITSNGKTIDTPITVNAPGSTVKFADALTQGSTRNFTFTAGTLEFAASATSTVGNFVTSGTTPKTLKSTTNGVQATLSQASGTVNATYTTIQDINATGGATWNAFYVNNNVDAGNNTGWNFTDNPINVSEVTMRLRSFTEPRSF